MVKFLKTQWYKIVYVVAVIIYLIFLNGLNHKLMRYNFENSFKLIEYDDYIALKFFAFAVIFIFIGAVIICIDIKRLRIGLEDMVEIVSTLIFIVVLALMITLIIHFIMVPILQAILTCALLVVGACASASN